MTLEALRVILVFWSSASLIPLFCNVCQVHLCFDYPPAERHEFLLRVERAVGAQHIYQAGNNDFVKSSPVSQPGACTGRNLARLGTPFCVVQRAKPKCFTCIVSAILQWEAA